MIKLSTGLRVGLAVTGGYKQNLDNGLIHIYSGTVPAGADSDIGSATLLVTISAGGTGDPLTFESSAPGGVLSKTAAENWTGNNIASGTPTFFRWVVGGDDGSSSTTQVRFQGSVGPVGSDLVITSLPLVSGQPQALELFEIVVPEQ